MKFGDVLNRVSELVKSEDYCKNIRPAFSNNTNGRIIIYAYSEFKHTDTGDSVNLNHIDFVNDEYTEIMFDLKEGKNLSL